jgi:hypothetical protein
VEADFELQYSKGRLFVSTWENSFDVLLKSVLKHKCVDVTLSDESSGNILNY